MRARDLAVSLRAFTAERAPVGVVLALSVSLSVGPWALAGGDGPALVRSAVVVFLSLVVLRIADDLRSLEHDRIASPDRALSAGRIGATPLAAGAAVLFAAAALLSAPRMTVGLGLVCAYYAAYYAVVDRIPLPLRPPLVNAAFLAIPPGVGLLVGDSGAPEAWMLGLFFWLSAVGHDYAHEVHGLAEARPGVMTCSRRLGSRLTAGVGAACYAGAFVAGLLAARGAHALGGWPPPFMAGLIILFGYVGVRLAGLIARPCRARARRLYVSGIACFAVPSLLLGLDRLLGW